MSGPDDMQAPTNELSILSVPEYCMQGSQFPFYMIWDKSQSAKVRIELPPGVSVKELYNVSQSDVTLDGSQIIISKVDVNGYLGGVFSCIVYPEPDVRTRLHFDIVKGNSSTSIFKNVRLFRPEVRVVRSPNEIRVGFDRKGKISLSDRLDVTNSGVGTGVIQLRILESSEVKDEVPEGLGEFAERFGDDLLANLKDVQKQFPNHSEVIELLIQFVNKELRLDELEKLKIKELQESLKNAIESDEKFREKLAEAFVTAYLKNVFLLTDVDTFLVYLRSISKKRLLIFDPISTIGLSSVPKKLSAQLLVSDLAQNKYKPIDLPPISLVAEKDCKIPIYELVGSTSPGGQGRQN